MCIAGYQTPAALYSRAGLCLAPLAGERHTPRSMKDPPGCASVERRGGYVEEVYASAPMQMQRDRRSYGHPKFVCGQRNVRMLRMCAAQWSQAVLRSEALASIPQGP